MVTKYAQITEIFSLSFSGVKLRIIACAPYIGISVYIHNTMAQNQSMEVLEASGVGNLIVFNTIF